MVLDILAKFDAKATFFCLGKNVERHPGLFRQLTEAGHAVGNHTFDHLNGWQTGSTEYFKNTEKADTLIVSALFRPPYGKITPAQISLLKKKYRIIMWDVISGDFDPGTSAEQCVKNVLKNVRPGSIIVFHDTLKAKEKLSYALPIVLKELTGQGYEMLSLKMP
jgi:peptidoglycan/xylan/chitin deacetylase (PgdA/CDA1 family)